jgi:uncharacterized protein (TIGR03435 family)
VGRVVVLTTLLATLAALSAKAASPQQVTGTVAPQASARTLDAPAKPEFEVASVKESAPDAPARGTEVLSPFHVYLPRGGRLSANALLGYYIIFAYSIADTSQYPHLLDGLPGWVRTQHFTIETKAEGNPTTGEVRLMMQSLLESRFKLASHREIRQQPVFALVLIDPGRPGPRLWPHAENAVCKERGDEPLGIATGKAPPVLYCGWNNWSEDGRLHQQMINVPIEDVVGYLGGAAGIVGGREHRPILDQTGLKGNFDMDFEFARDQLGTSEDSFLSGPTFTKALEQQLGMKLVKTTGPVSVMVIDHIEKPSAD